MGLLATVKSWLGFVPPPSPAELALLAAIAAAPAEDAPRVAYADFLSKKRPAQAEYIRLAVECEQFDVFDAWRSAAQSRLQELLNKHGSTWLRPLRSAGLEPTIPDQPPPALWFHRGLVENIWVNKPGVVPQRLPQLFALAPALQQIALRSFRPDWLAIASSPWMARIQAMNLAEAPLELAELQLLADAPALSQIATLDLSNKEYGLKLIQTLASSAQWNHLQNVRLQFCQLDSSCAELLASSPKSATLLCLDLTHNQLGNEGTMALASGQYFTRLERLCLGNNGLSSKAISSLASGDFPALTELNLESSEPDIESLKCIAEAPWASQLRTLNLGWNRAGDNAVIALLRPNTFTGLRLLGLSGNNLTDHGLQTILTMPVLGELRMLDLSSNNLGGDGIAAIIQASTLKNLRQLLLYSVDLTNHDKAQLVERFGATGVQF